MPAKKKAPALPAIQSKEQLHTTVDEIARLEITIRQACAVRDAAVQLVLDEHEGTIEADKERVKALTKLAATYADSHRSEVFGEKLKSSATARAKFGFREGNDTLKTLNNKWSWEKVKANLKALGQYLRTVEEVDKDSIHNAKLTDAQLAEMGMRIDKGETFFITSKAEDAGRITAKNDDADAA